MIVSGQGPAGANTGYDLYLLVGQSNMAGRAPVDAASKETDSRIWMLDKSDHWAPATDPVHFDKPEKETEGKGVMDKKRSV